MPLAKPVAEPDSVALIAALPCGLQALAQRGVVRHFRKGAVLIEEGTQGDTLFVLMKGSVKAFSVDERGREIVYGICGVGEYVGEMSLDGGPRSVSIATLESTTCSVVTRATLRAHIAAHPDFAFELIERVIRRVRVLTENARSMALLDVYGRLVRLLNSMAATSDDGRRVRPRPTHGELASRIGASREMVSRLLKDLERGGYIAVQGDALALLKVLPPSW